MAAVDVVVCTHDSQRLPVLSRCLSAIVAELRGEDRLIVVVDHNDDLRIQLQEQWGFRGPDEPQTNAPANEAPRTPIVTITGNTGPRGLSAARNTGMYAGSGEIICFIDDDATAQPGWRAALEEAFRDATITAIGGRVEPEFVDSHGHPTAAPSGLPAVHGWIYGCDYQGMAAAGEQIRNPIGAAMALRRPAAELVGEFSTHLGRNKSNGAGAEETDFFLRLSSMLPEARIIRHPSFAVRHQVPPERTTWRYFIRRAFQEGRSKSILSSATHGSTKAEAQHLQGAIPAQLRTDLSRLLSPAGVHALRSIWLNASVVAATGIGFISGRSGANPLGHNARDMADVNSNQPIVSVVVCTDGRSHYLVDALESVSANHPQEPNGGEVPMEIIVVDNSLAGDLADRPQLQQMTHADPRLRIVRAPVPGLSRARNRGISQARGQYIAFTDDDAVVDKHWVQELLQGFDHPAVYCVTGRTFAYDLSKEVYRLFEELVSFDKGPQGRRWNLSTAHPPPLYPLPAGSFGAGNNMAFRTSAFAELGGFAEELGAGRPTRGGEDLDMFRRVVLAGRELVYRPEAVVEHRHRDTYDSLRTQFYGYGLGMTASLTRAIWDNPATLRTMVRQLPAAVKYFFSIRSGGSSSPATATATAAPATAARAADTPATTAARAAVATGGRCTRIDLLSREILGLLSGPLVFGRTRIKDALIALGFTTRN